MNSKYQSAAKQVINGTPIETAERLFPTLQAKDLDELVYATKLREAIQAESKLLMGASKESVYESPEQRLENLLYLKATADGREEEQIAAIRNHRLKYIQKGDHSL